MIFNKKQKNLNPLSKGLFESPVVCYLFPFIIFGGYLLYYICGNFIPSATGYYLIHYLYTYDHGFISRGLVGEIISWFTDIVTDDITRNVITLFSFLLMVGMSLCIGKALSKTRTDRENFGFIFFIVMMIFIIPMPFKYYYTDMKLDKLVWALTLFSVFIADTKVGKWLVPLICIIATVVNPIFVFTSMILIAIILLQEFYSSGFSAKNGIICGFTYVSIIAFTLFAAISEKWVGFENAGEMVDYYFTRYAGQLEDSYRERFISMWIIDFFIPFEDFFSYGFEIYFKEWGMGIRSGLHLLFIGLPAYILSGTFWHKAIKIEENKFQKFVYFLCMISPVAILPAVVLSWEFPKLFYNNIFVQAGLIVYFIVKNNYAVCDVCKKVKSFGKRHLLVSVIVILYFITYMAALFNY